MKLAKLSILFLLSFVLNVPVQADVAVNNNYLVKWGVSSKVHVYGIKSARIYKTTRVGGAVSEAHIQMHVNIEGNICPATDIALQKGVAAEDGTQMLSLVGLEATGLYLVPRACIEISAPRTIQLRFAVSSMTRESSQSFLFNEASLSAQEKLYKGFRAIYDGKGWTLELY